MAQEITIFQAVAQLVKHKLVQKRVGLIYMGCDSKIQGYATSLQAHEKNLRHCKLLVQRRYAEISLAIDTASIIHALQSETVVNFSII